MMHKKENACIALHLTCLFTLAGSSITFSSNSKDGTFECNTIITLSCHVQSYTSMSMFRNNSLLADCFFASCTTYAALQGYMNFNYDAANGVFNVTINPITEKDNNISFRCSDGTNQDSITPDVKVSNNATVEKRTDSFANGSIGLTATSGCVYTDLLKLKWTSQKVGEDTQNDIAADKLSTTYITAACSSNPDCFNGNGTRQIQETGIFLPATFHNNHSVYACFYNSGNCKPYEKFDGYFQIEDKANESNSKLTAILMRVLIPAALIIFVVVVVVVLCVPCCICYQCNCFRKVKCIHISAKTDLHPVVLEWSAPYIKNDSTQFMIICEEVVSQQTVIVRTQINMTRQQFEKLKCCVYGLTPRTTYQFHVDVRRSDRTLTAQSSCRKVQTLDIIRLAGEANGETEITLWWNSNCNLRKSILLLTTKIIQQRNPIISQDNNIYIEDVDYSKSLKSEGYTCEIKREYNLKGTYPVKGLEPRTRYVFFITMINGTTVTQSNAIEIQTLELKLEMPLQDKGKTTFKVIGSIEGSITLNTITTFVKVDRETPTVQLPKPTLYPQSFEIDGLDPKKSTCIWITLGNMSSNIIYINGREALAIELRLERRQTREARFVVKLSPDLGSPEKCVLFYGDELNQEEQNINDWNKCIVSNLAANVCYWYFVEATVGDKTYSSNIIRDQTSGKTFIRQRLQE